ncbi:hypothetical protein MBLNU230_g0261t1 [Neophaeotheca triangularis]
MTSSSGLFFHPALPAHCEPTTDFLLRFSSAFHTCVPTPLAFLSTALGTLSIVAWLFAQLPQIAKNYNIKSTSGLSAFFLIEWCLGDISNLLGALFTHQASWQVIIGCYYVFVDLCLVGQWLWYEKLKHGKRVRRVWNKGGNDNDTGAGEGMQQVVIEGRPLTDGAFAELEGQESNAKDETHHNNNKAARPQVIFRQPTFTKDEEKRTPSSSLTSVPTNRKTIHRAGGGGRGSTSSPSPFPSPSPRTILFLACLVALTHANPLPTHPTPLTSQTPTPTPPTPLEKAGTLLSWVSAALYLISRLPQLLKNYSRKSTTGLSPHLFLAAFFGNLFYASALAANPRVWNSYPAHGCHGWVGPQASERAGFVLAVLPFFLGAAGVLGLDASVGVQFWVYGGRGECDGGGGGGAVVVVEGVEGRGGGRWRWRRVSGWMRGWVPSVSSGSGDGRGDGEREALIECEDDGREGGRGYGGI